MTVRKEDLKAIISDIIEEDDLQDTDHFIEDLGLDSMMALEIVAQLENKYKIVIPEETLIRITSLNEVYELVSEIHKKSTVEEERI